MGSNGKKHKTEKEATKALQTRVAQALSRPDLDPGDLKELETQLLQTVKDPSFRTTLSLLCKISRQRTAPRPTVRIEGRYTVEQAAKILSIGKDHLRREVGAGNIETCPRIEPGQGKGQRGGRIYFLRRHLEDYSGKTAS